MVTSETPIVTYVTCAIAVIAAVGGMVVVVLGHAGALSFEEYLNLMTKFVFGLGIVGIGRGVSAGLKNHGATSARSHGDNKTLKTGV